MTSYNGQMVIRGRGKRYIRCTEIRYGLDIIAAADNESRSRRSFYSIATTASDFTAVLVFISWQERETFNHWLQNWQVDLIDDRSVSPFVTVSVPPRNFLRTAVLSGTLSYGEAWNDVIYPATLTFQAASNPVTHDLANLKQFTSRFQGATHGEVTNRFYPAGVQVSGAETLDSQYYDPSPQPLGALEPIDDRLDRFGQATP